MTERRPKSRRAKLPVTIDPGSPEAGRGGVVPPRETRWQPGESGNPSGWPKGAATSLDRILEQELDRLGRRSRARAKRVSGRR